MEGIKWGGVQGSGDNCRVDETKVMYKVFLPEAS